MTQSAARNTRRRRGMFLRLPLYYVCNLHELHHYFILGTRGMSCYFTLILLLFPGVALIYEVERICQVQIKIWCEFLKGTAHTHEDKS
jgi:hypothetical protein